MPYDERFMMDDASWYWLNMPMVRRATIADRLDPQFLANVRTNMVRSENCTKESIGTLYAARSQVVGNVLDEWRCLGGDRPRDPHGEITSMDDWRARAYQHLRIVVLTDVVSLELTPSPVRPPTVDSFADVAFQRPDGSWIPKPKNEGGNDLVANPTHASSWLGSDVVAHEATS